MKDAIKTGSAYVYSQLLLDVAKEAVTDPDRALDFTLIAVAETGRAPVATRITATTDLDRLLDNLEAHHLMHRNGNPFSFLIEPNFDGAYAQHTTLGINFKPVVTGRQMQWLATQPPGTPKIVESAKLQRGLWQMELSIQREEMDDLIEPEEPIVSLWGPKHTIGEFRTALATTLRCIEYGLDAPAFGRADSILGERANPPRRKRSPRRDNG